MNIKFSEEYINSIEKLPIDIRSLIEKKVKYLGIHDFKMFAIDKAELPQTSILLDFRKCGDDLENWESNAELLKEKYINQLIDLGLDTSKYSIWIYFKSENSDAVTFELSSPSFDNCRYTFHASYFLPYYVAHYDLWITEDEVWEKTNIPQNEIQGKIWEIFNIFFKLHWYSELNKEIMNIPLPIVGENHGWEDEYPYRVYELLFWE